MPTYYKMLLVLLGCCYTSLMGRDSSVGIATSWTVRGSNPNGGRDFPHPSRPTLGPTRPPIQWVPGSFPGVKRPQRGVDHPPASKCRGWRKSRAIHLLPLWASVACSRENLYLYLYLILLWMTYYAWWFCFCYICPSYKTQNISPSKYFVISGIQIHLTQFICRL